MRPARYSGPHRSGICICGHSWQDHHLGMVATMTGSETDGGQEYYIPQECEYYGCNEDGGFGPQGEAHCNHYLDTLFPKDPDMAGNS